MAYKPKHSETLINRNNENFIKNFEKFDRKYVNKWIKLYALMKEAYPNQHKPFYEMLHELLGTKRYTGENIPIGTQYSILKKFNEIKNFMKGKI